MTVQVLPICDNTRDEAAALLKQGFPEHEPVFWDETLRMLGQHADQNDTGPIGHVMRVKDQPAGVILTIRSERASGASMTNLSSWYVDDKHRWLALHMLKRVTSDPTRTYTDFSPSAETVKLNTALGFRTTTDAIAAFPLPLTAIFGRAGAKVLPYSNRNAEALSDEDRALLVGHQRLGCLCGVLVVDGRYSPLIFIKMRRRNLNVARLVYALDRRVMIDHGAAVARFLLRSGMMVLTMHIKRGEYYRTAVVRRRTAIVQVKGDWDDWRIDKVFSELTFLPQ